MRTRGRLAAALLGLFFLFQSACLLSRPGISAAELWFDLLETALSSTVLAVVRPSSSALRLPLILVGALTVFLATRFYRRAVGGPAAIAAGILLASDSAFLLSTRLNANHVVFPRLLLIAGCLLTLKFWHHPSRVSLTAAGLCFGLACACHPSAACVLAGLVLGVALVFREEVKAAWGGRNVVPALSAFLLGLLPMLASRPPAPIPFPVDLLRVLDASAWFGYAIRNDYGTWGIGPHGWLERVCVSFANAFGYPRHTAFALLLAGTILTAATLLFLGEPRTDRTLRFAFTSVAASALLLLFTQRASSGSVLVLWPLLYLLIAAVLRELLARWTLAPAPVFAAVVLCVVSSVAVTATFYAHALLYGGTPEWSEAIYNLAGDFDVHDARAVRILSPGIEAPLQYLRRGAVPVVRDNAGSETLFIARTTQPLDAHAHPVRVVQDFQGRGVFVLYRVD